MFHHFSESEMPCPIPIPVDSNSREIVEVIMEVDEIRYAVHSLTFAENELSKRLSKQTTRRAAAAAGVVGGLRRFEGCDIWVLGLPWSGS